MTFEKFVPLYNDIAKKNEVRKKENQAWYIYNKEIMHLTTGNVCYSFPNGVAITVINDKVTKK